MISALLIILAALSKALADTLTYHFDTSIFRNKNPRFWNPVKSSDWAKRIFNYKIDAWHLANSVMIVFMIAAIALHQFNNLAWYFEIIIGGLLWNVSFNTAYNKLFK